MKSEFILAFNEICESRGLPKEDVFEALRKALVSAYRRDANVSNTQQVEAEIDPLTGEPTIYAEKEVVDSIFDNRTEVLLAEAKRQGFKEAELGDLVMVDSTTASFGRIAAQTAKQVLLQGVREAEREQLFEDFSGREGELVNGTVQSISGQHITIGLGRTEAIMPKGHQVPGERYRAHDKIRVFVLEVRRTSRGPQIFVSRNHRNLLRRLLELEVPEIYNGQVDIKSIAREAGQRSKVAVQALQPGVDPVGACVGMRGVRIQSIVRELNDEKIDVIEWDPDQRTFISKALSPARVSKVFLEEHPDEGKTAVVIVPDDQLSLAIGREGQNARLAAKLTGWRIDIKSLTEAAAESVRNLDDPAVSKATLDDKVVLDKVQLVLEKKEDRRPITSEDYQVLDRFVGQVEGAIIASRATLFEEIREQRAEARQAVPPVAWELPLEELDLPGRVHNLLLDAGIETVGDVIYTLTLGDDAILEIKGLGDVALATVKTAVDEYEIPERVVEEEVEAGAAEDVAVIEVEAAQEAETAPPAAVDVELAPEPAAALIEEPEAEAAEATEEVEAVEEEPEETADILDDLSRPLVIEEEEEEKKQAEKAKIVLARQPAAEPTVEEKARTQKGRQLVFDEEAGTVVVKRKRKGSRRKREWEDYEVEDA